MKTPEEIKHTLRYCWCKDEKHQCIKCPYNKENDSCDKALDADALAYIQQLEDHIRDLTKMVPRWISVEDRLPENGQKVIATFKNEEGVIVDQARYSNGEFDFASWAYVWHENITHWMPMPELPGTGESNEREQV